VVCAHLGDFSRSLGFRRIRADSLDGGDELPCDFGSGLGILGARAEYALAEAYGHPPLVTADENEGLLARWHTLPPPHRNGLAAREVLQSSSRPLLAGFQPVQRRADCRDTLVRAKTPRAIELDGQPPGCRLLRHLRLWAPSAVWHGARIGERVAGPWVRAVVDNRYPFHG